MNTAEPETVGGPEPRRRRPGGPRRPTPRADGRARRRPPAAPSPPRRRGAPGGPRSRSPTTPPGRRRGGGAAPGSPDARQGRPRDDPGPPRRGAVGVGDSPTGTSAVSISRCSSSRLLGWSCVRNRWHQQEPGGGAGAERRDDVGPAVRRGRLDADRRAAAAVGTADAVTASSCHRTPTRAAGRVTGGPRRTAGAGCSGAGRPVHGEARRRGVGAAVRAVEADARRAAGRHGAVPRRVRHGHGRARLAVRGAPALGDRLVAGEGERQLPRRPRRRPRVR